MNPVTVEDLRRALALSGAAGGDHALNPGMGRHPAPRPAAVLCPIVPRAEGLRMILTVRPTTMRAHAGQVALPGGKVDPTDRDALDAALRESEEEIGLPARDVTLLGALAPYVTRTGYAIAPFVGLVPADFVPAPEPGEVEAVFETPLDVLMDLAMHRRHAREFGGVRRDFWAVDWEGRFIWGATAGILRGLAERVAEARAAAA